MSHNGKEKPKPIAQTRPSEETTQKQHDTQFESWTLLYWWYGFQPTYCYTINVQ